MRDDKQLFSNSMESTADGTNAAAVSKEVTAATTTTIAGNEVPSGTGSGYSSETDSAPESVRCHTGGQEQQQRYRNNRWGPQNKQHYNNNRFEPVNERYHNNRNGPRNANGNGNWHQFQSYNSRPWQNGRRTHFNNNNNNWNNNSNYSRNNSRNSYHNQNNSNWQHNNNNWKSSDSFNSYNCGDRPDFRRNTSNKLVKWSTRDTQDRTDYYRNSRRSREKSYDRRESDWDQSSSRSQSCESRESRKERNKDRENDIENPTSEQKEKQQKLQLNKERKKSQNDKQISIKKKGNIKKPSSRENSTDRKKSVETEKAAPCEKLEKSISAKPKDVIKDTLNTVKIDEISSKSIDNDNTTTQPTQNLNEAQSKLITEIKLNPVEDEKETGAISTYPQIQVRPLSELLKQEIIAVTQEKLQVDSPVSPSGNTVITPPPRPVSQIRRHIVGSAANNGGIGESIINDRLANMDKESLKYIINNSDTIYNEHLKSQARRRLRDEIRRQLKEIEFEQPKDKPPKDLVEDEIVDAIKLPQLLLKEIEKCFGIDISEPKTTEENNTGSAENKEENSPETLKSEIVTAESDQSVIEIENFNSEKHPDEEELPETKELPDSMAKESSTDLTTRLKIAEQFKALAAKKSISAQLTEAAKPQSPRKAKSIEQKANPHMKKIENRKQTQFSEQESQKKALPIKKEVKTEVRASPSIDCIVLSSSEDENEDENEKDVQHVPQSTNVISLVHENDVSSDLSNSSNDSKEQLYQQKLNEDADHVVSTFEKLILPQLKGSLADRYRSNHSANLKSRLHFISCVVTSNEHNSRSFSKIEVARIQQNLKETYNRLGLDFLLREIDNVVNEKQKSQTESNELITSSSKSAELASEAHQRNGSIDVEAAETAFATAERASMPPTPPRNGTPTNVANPTRPLHALPLGPFLGLESTLPRLSPGNYPVPSSLESNDSILQMGESVMHNLLDIDRRLLENQNRRGFLEEMIIKFQKEKSDLEMVSLELQSRKFLLLNSVISRSTTINATPSTAASVTPINSPPPTVPATIEATSSESLPPAASSIPAVEKPKKRQRRVIVKRVKIFPKRKARGKCFKTLQSNKVPGELESNKEQLEESTDSAIPEPIAKQLNVKQESKKENDDINKRAADSTLAGSPKRQRLTRSATLNATQQPLAVIPPLSPPPPPPEPIANMSYELPRILQKSTPPSPPAEALRNSNPMPKNYKYDYIPSGPLHKITSPITQIRIYKLHIIAASENGDIYVFNIANHKLERQIIKHSEAITHMFLCEQESYLYTTSLDGFLKKSSLENLERVMQTVYLKEPLQSIDIAWGVAFVGSRWGHIFTYNIATNKVMDMPLLSTGQSIIAVKATKEGARRIIMLGCKGNFVFLHDAASGLLLRRLSIPEGLNVYSLLLIDGHVFCGTQKNEVYKFEFASGNMCNSLSCGNGAVAMAVYQDKYLLIGCYDGFIYVLNKETGMKLGRFNGPGRLVLALAIVGDKVVTSSKDNALQILEIPSELLNLEQSN
ncbi:zinc finger protein 106 [Drosophila innubila]|uniref:zinc finger protein 106 n=1 Tax=Drosophila innubila TaxID=198719 RepID=UPI00148C23B1|nr:zinc finger protein 106 [Drosophila innubila]